MFCKLIKIKLPLRTLCPSGEIGRRTVFRSQRSHGRAGSNPVSGTFFKIRFFGGFYFFQSISVSKLHLVLNDKREYNKSFT